MYCRKCLTVIFIFLLNFALFVDLPASGQQKRISGTPKAEEFDYSLILKALKVRNIGPANMGGRVVDLAVPESNTSVIYAAIGPSGLWKSEDSGITWTASFYKEKTVAVGAVAVSESHPDIVWVGTGEATARNSVAPGDGVYKSEDAGKTWKNMGLQNTRFISRIAIDPVNPDIIYVAAQGNLWAPNEERGVYKTTDGGKNWRKVLYVDSDTGACDLAMDPSNSRILYAGMWTHRRLPYYFNSGGDGSAIFKSTDGGETWKKTAEGLPPGPYGRIGVGVSRSNPNVVYALVEARDGGLFRSENKGETWRRTCDKATYDRVNFRPFYYSRLTVDPNNELVVYVYSGSAFVSKDGGKTFEMVFRGAHPDHHSIWVNPHNSRHVISGNDGGIDISWDGGRNAYAVQSQAWAEIYNLTYDMRDPYYVNIGLQDNGNWQGPSNSREASGIINSLWVPTGSGDGFYAQIDPVDWWILYRNLQMGGIERHNLKTGTSQRIRPEASLKEEPYRFNWNSPIYLSRHDRNILYFGGNFLFKSTDRGQSWVKASPDLTTNNPAKIKDSGGLTMDNTGAENHCTITAIAESPLKQGLIWVGTDDGQVQLTRDSGKNWENVTRNIKGLGPDDNWVTRIEAGHHAEGTAYLTVSRHQVGDFKPYIFKTEDFGKTWVSIKGNLPDYGYLHVVREGLETKNLLFAGSEFGLFISVNGGKSWIPYTNDFQTVAVRDIQIHPRDRDLIIGTHGRGVYIIDDIRPLEKLASEAVKADALLFDVKPAMLFTYQNTVDIWSDPGFTGKNSPFGAAISYYINPAIAREAKVRLTILDKENKFVATLSASREAGLNRVYWNLREGASMAAASIAETTEFGGFRFAGAFGGGGFAAGPWVLPGEYKVVLDVNDQKIEKPVLVKEDPLEEISMEDRRLAQKYFYEARDLAQKGRQLLQSLDSLTKQLDDVSGKISGLKNIDPVIQSQVKTLKDKIGEIKSVYFLSPPEQTIYRKPLKVALRGGTAAELITGITRSFTGMGAPTQTAIDQLNDLAAFLEPLLAKMKEIADKDVPALNKLLAEKGVPYIKI